MLPMDLAGQYRHGSSTIHGLDPRIKLIATLLFVLVATLLPYGAWLCYGLLFCGTLVVARISGLGLVFALKRSFVALPFALAAITLPFTVPGQPLTQLGPLTVSLEGSVRFLSILLKSWVSVQAAILMTVTTPFPDLLWGLRALRLPHTLVSIIGFMYRYLFVLADEALRLRRARAARSGTGAGRSGGSLRWRGRVAGGMIGNLALRAFERSERVYAAMQARGFAGEIRTLAHPILRETDRVALAGWITYLAMVGFIGLVF
jgi:cobalt/nickel transport system permease protein